MRLGQIALELDRTPDVIDGSGQQSAVGLITRARHLVLPEPRVREPDMCRGISRIDLDGALAVLRLNATVFPESGNVWDSLAEGYLAAGRTELAEIYYRKSLELDPDNVNALEKLRELKRTPANED